MSDILGSLQATRREAMGLLGGAATVVASPALARVGGMSLAAASDAISPFRVDAAQSALDDLTRRLGRTRWPDRETVSDWSQGVPLEKAKALIAYWREHYDWRRFEARINRWPQFRTQIDGLGIHFLHIRSPDPEALPLILTHGWPGSVVEFLDAIPLLTDPARHGGKSGDAFHLVIPSLPGFGFSDRPAEAKWDVGRIAAAWAILMGRLGYDRWVAQGGDWGSGVTHALGHLRPPGLLAAHVNWPLVFPRKLPEDPAPNERAAIDAAARFAPDGSGYFNLQATRPQTISYSLADSPAGQALWIYEKFQAWSDNQGEPEDVLSIDAMLDNISLYWLTNTAASSARIYWQNSRQGPLTFGAGRIELPMAASIFPREIYRAPKAWAEASWPSLFYWNEVDRGGHFAAFEQPQLFTEELRAAFRAVRRPGFGMRHQAGMGRPDTK